MRMLLLSNYYCLSNVIGDLTDQAWYAAELVSHSDTLSLFAGGNVTHLDKPDCESSGLC
jgi:hypothetical protein